jgi:class 3 adenylate cyclase
VVLHGGEGVMSETRKIAAILVADVVGYSRLAGADEDRILARLRALRSDLIDPTIAVRHGRIVKRTGDGAIVEFRSVVDAVRCAIEVQNARFVLRASAFRSRVLNLAKTCSIGLRSGEYLGRKTRRAPTARMAFRLIGPSNRQGASMRSLRRAARNVAVFHLPCGTLSTRRSPFGAILALVGAEIVEDNVIHKISA